MGIVPKDTRDSFFALPPHRVEYFPAPTTNKTTTKTSLNSITVHHFWAEGAGGTRTLLNRSSDETLDFLDVTGQWRLKPKVASFWRLFKKTANDLKVGVAPRSLPSN